MITKAPQLFSIYDLSLLEIKKHARSQFSTEEDEKLKKLVEIYGESSWNTVSSKMKNRNPRQCKERWNYYLSPKINKNPWTAEEDELLEKLYSLYGPDWPKISKIIEGRTYINVKNRFQFIQRRKKNQIKKDIKEMNETKPELEIFENDLQNILNMCESPFQF